MTSGDVLAIGEVLWDILPTERLLGGAPANFCNRLRQLGIPALLVSRTGSDSLGVDLRSHLTGSGLDLSLVQVDDEHATGTVDVVLTSDGNPSFSINTDVAYDYIEASPELIERARTCRLICFGTLVQRAKVSRASIQSLLHAAKDAVKFLDINLRRNCYTAASVENSLEFTNILKLNVSEAVVLKDLLKLSSTSYRDVAEELLRRYNLDCVLTTLGADGVFALSSSGIEVTIPGIAVQVVDTIGSGDAFSAAFVYKLLNGADLAECCRFGNVLGALSATKKGGMPVITSDEIAACLEACVPDVKP